MLESICAIGFSGHRELARPELIEKKIEELLDDIGEKTSSRLVAVSSIAVGADILFVEACLKRKIPWIAILPMSPELFFNEQDFPDAKSRAHAISLLETATSVEFTNPIIGNVLPESARKEYREVAFTDSGRRIVDYCDVFVAALRQSEDKLKPGGTGDIVSYVKHCDRPIAIIDPDTGEIHHHLWRGPFEPAFVREIATLPETPLGHEFLAADNTAEMRAFVDYFSRLSAAARRSVPRLRSMSSTAVFLHGCAVLLALALITWARAFLSPLGVHVAEWSKLILAGAALAATIWFIWGKPHARAARYRLGTEICRSIMATWNLPETHREIFRTLPVEYRELVRMLLNFRRLEGPRMSELRASDSSHWKEPVADYLKDRIHDQLAYYRREQTKGQRWLHILEPLIGIFAIGGLLFAAFAAFQANFALELGGQIAEGVVEFGKVAFPFFAGTLIALLAVHESTRRKGRYGEMLEVLKENAKRLESAPHQKAACEIVIDNERALLAENIEWANTAKHPAAV
jgi:hypothetical protein